MTFQFSLATVLRVREIAEEREERLLQQILFEIVQSLESLERVRQQIAGFDFSLHAEIDQRFSGYHVNVAYGEKQQLKRDREEIEERLRKLEHLRDQQLAAYEAARRNREMLTDMRREQRIAYDTGLAKREQRIVDDHYVARRGPRKGTA